MTRKAEFQKYNVSFTAGGLLFHESILVASVFIETASWVETQNKVIESNLLKARTVSSSKRIFREISLRLKQLSEEAIEFLIESSNETGKRQILWYAVCKSYPFICDFSKEVIQKKVSVLDFHLLESDYDRFFNQKAQWHTELENISQSTAKKIKQVLFKILREVGYLSKSGDIIAEPINPRVIEIISSENKTFLEVFPLAQIYSKGVSV